MITILWRCLKSKSYFLEKDTEVFWGEIKGYPGYKITQYERDRKGHPPKTGCKLVMVKFTVSRWDSLNYSAFVYV